MPSKSKEEDTITLSTFNIVRRAIIPALGRLYDQAESCFYASDYLKQDANGAHVQPHWRIYTISKIHSKSHENNNVQYQER
jgi:hypothetical protein